MTFSPQFRQQLQIWWPAALAMLTGGLLSLALWHVLEKRQAQLVHDRLEQQAHLFTSSLEQRMYAYADYLKGMHPIFAMQPRMSLEGRRAALEDGMRYPGVEVVTIVRQLDAQDYATYREALLRDVPPQGRVDVSAMSSLPLDKRTYLVVDEVWPAHARRHLRGMDVTQLPAYVQQITQLQNRQDPLLSAPLMLPESAGRVTGVVVSVPLRDAQGLQGIVNLSLRADTLVEQFKERGMLHNVDVAIHDTTRHDPLAPRALYATFEQVLQADVVQQPAVQRELSLMGREWSLNFVPSGLLLSPLERWFPRMVALGALAATVLLSAVVLLLSLQRIRAQAQTKAQQDLLRQRTDRLKALFHQSAIGVVEVVPCTGGLVNANTRFTEMLGVVEDTPEQRSIYTLIHEADRDKYRRLERQLLEGQLPHFNITQRMLRGDGGVIWVEMWLSPLLGLQGQRIGRFFVLLIDITERRLMEEQLQAREAYSSEMLRYMPVGLVVVGPSGAIECVNQQFEEVTGWGQSDLADESQMWRHLCVDMQQHAALLQRLNAGRCEVVATGVNMPSMEYLLRSKDGRELSMEVSGRFLGGRILLSFVDVSPRKAAEEEIRWLGYYDTLTQLPNRRLLLDRLGEALARSQRSSGHKGALLLLDIDNFKSLNETLGHDHGDALLRLVATRLSTCIQMHHTLARQGGDEFAVVLEDLPTDPLEAGRCTEQVGRAILQALRTPFYLNNQDLHVTVSMGAVVFSAQGDSVEELLKRADLALYQAKSAGRDTLQFFDPRMQKAVSARVEMEKDIRMALERHEFDLFFQPQVQRDQVVGAEALLRWQHPHKGYISPSVFVPAAEESGLILPLGEWVLYAACRQLAHWAKMAAMADLTMSVNVSPRQFYQPDFVAQVERALQVTGARPEQLELELTEGMLLTDIEDTIQKMVQLKAMGVIFSLDDFGTGYSSLSYLKRLPLDKLKIDQSFVREVESSANDAAIARSIIALGHSLGLQVIAEGVETEAQRQFLEGNGCSYWQGFLFSRPQPAARFETWVQHYGHQMLQDVMAAE